MTNENMAAQNGTPAEYGAGSAMRGTMARAASMRAAAPEAEEAKEKIKHRAKMKKYKERHDKAVETFKTITGETVETREGAVKALAWIMKNKSYTQAAEAILAASDFCWACNEEDAEKDVKEEVETLSALAR